MQKALMLQKLQQFYAPDHVCYTEDATQKTGIIVGHNTSPFEPDCYVVSWDDFVTTGAINVVCLQTGELEKTRIDDNAGLSKLYGNEAFRSVLNEHLKPSFCKISAYTSDEQDGTINGAYVTADRSAEHVFLTIDELVHFAWGSNIPVVNIADDAEPPMYLSQQLAQEIISKRNELAQGSKNTNRQANTGRPFNMAG